jgi:hypothetical protein
MSAGNISSSRSSVASSAANCPPPPKLLDLVEASTGTESEALHGLRERRRVIIDLRAARVFLRNRLEPIYSVSHGFERGIDIPYVAGDAPKDALLDVERIIRVNERVLGQLLGVCRRATKERLP